MGSIRGCTRHRYENRDAQVKYFSLVSFDAVFQTMVLGGFGLSVWLRVPEIWPQWRYGGFCVVVAAACWLVLSLALAVATDKNKRD